jgi:hypothetical protein
MVRPAESPDDGDESDVVEARFDWDTIQPATAVVETVADALDLDPTAVESLFETIDPDALNRLLVPNQTNESSTPIAVAFEYAGRTVTATNAGAVVVTDRQADDG